MKMQLLNNLKGAKNSGATIEKRLNEIGVFSLADPAQMTPVKAYQSICRQNTGKTFPVCYYLYSLQDALLDLIKVIFNVKALRRYDIPDGTIMHAEIQIDDSVIMLGDSSDKFPPVKLVMHVYVPNGDEIFDKAIKAGCEIVEQPKQREGDPDRRATFKNFAGNMWSVGTQL
ncbi:MAG: TfoX/Sxy family DNA transformation protein [Bacteroidota bacterium]